MALVEATIEGPIEKIEELTVNGIKSVKMTAMNVVIHFVPGKVIKAPPDPPVPPGPVVPSRLKAIRSPSQRLSVDDLLSEIPMPGRGTIPGFVGGTVIAEGFFNTDDPNSANWHLDANFLTVEPAETVLIGTLTSNTNTTVPLNGTMTVNGVEIVMLSDFRQSSNPPAIHMTPSPPPPPLPVIEPVYRNEFGFEIQPINTSMIPTPLEVAPAPTAVEGYYDVTGKKMYAHLFEYGGRGLMIPSQAPDSQVSIERANVRVEATTFDVEIRGHVTTPHQPTGGPRQVMQVFFLDMKPGTTGLNEADWVRRSEQPVRGDWRIDFILPNPNPPNPLQPPVQRWRFEATIPKTGLNLLPPERVEVLNFTAWDQFHAPGKFFKTEDTDIRED